MAINGKTGVLIQNVKLFIEGIQIPYESISISQGVGSLPSASIAVPPQAGLMDIARFYQPKVHIFFEENTGEPAVGLTQDQLKIREKLIFSGHIRGVSYAKSTSGSGHLSINFDCVHKNYLVSECLLDFTGWIKDDTDVSSGNAVKIALANSQAAIIEALQGIDEIGPVDEVSIENPMGKTNVLPEKFGKYVSRYIGLPGVLLNYWNQINRAALEKSVSMYPQAFAKMYKPLLEDGLQFFQRVGGHKVVEYANQNGKQDPCLKQGASSGKSIMIPPSNTLYIQTAIQTSITVASLENFLSASGEITNLLAVFTSFYESIDYEMITLACPAEVPLYGPEVSAVKSKVKLSKTAKANSVAETAAIETIIKPKTPFYFAPTCNVIFPYMYESINVNYDEANIPTRIDMINRESPQGTGLGTHIRAPHSVRDAIAKAAISVGNETVRDLMHTMASSYGAIGVYEQGRGVKIEYNALPRWLSYLSNSHYSVDGAKAAYYPDEGSDAYAALQELQAGWVKRYPDKKDISMCPWTKEAGIAPHQRILFISVDYYFSMMFARSKAGSVQCLFNPYIVPGYPMDILERNPVLPSFHAMCTSVTHNFTSSSISTSVSFVAASTYSELANYYMPFILPALQVALRLAKNPTLVNSDAEAQEMADSFYHEVLGVGAAIPERIYDFDKTGMVKPIKKDATGKWISGNGESVTAENGGEVNPALTFQGNMELVSRPIENRKLYEERFGIKFVDLAPENYSPTHIEYTDSIKSSSTQLEIGASQFLTYNTKFGEKIV